MSNETKSTSTLTLEEINTHIKAELKAEFNLDVGFKTIDKETALSYITQVVLQRVKQRTRGKEERDLTKKMKQILTEKGIKF